MDFADAYNLVTNTAQYNNAWSAEQAAKQMEFQERMSNTAHQREVADLRAAGLNPVLSAKLGGASTPSGASASADTSLTGAVLELAQQAMEANTMSAAALYSGYGSSSKEEEEKKDTLSELDDIWSKGGSTDSKIVRTAIALGRAISPYAESAIRKAAVNSLIKKTNSKSAQEAMAKDKYYINKYGKDWKTYIDNSTKGYKGSLPNG